MSRFTAKEGGRLLILWKGCQGLILGGLKGNCPFSPGPRQGAPITCFDPKYHCVKGLHGAYGRGSLERLL